MLVQVRAANDPMSHHEVECVRRRFGERRYELSVRNAVAEPADGTWLEGFDAFLIGGSGDFSVHHPKSQVWVTPLRRLLDVALTQKLPGFGICFGHQLLGQHLGSKVETNPDHAEMGTVEIEVTTLGQKTPLLDDMPQRFAVHTGHSDCVSSIPPGVSSSHVSPMAQPSSTQPAAWQPPIGPTQS